MRAMSLQCGILGLVLSLPATASAQLSVELDGCALGAVRACYRAAGLSRPDAPEEADVERARATSRCAAGELDGCILQAVFEIVSGDPSQALLPTLERGCSRASPRACAIAAVYDSDRAGSVARTERGCEYGDEDACASVAGARMREDPAGATTLLEASCSRGGAAACLFLGGRAGAGSPRRLELFARACSLGLALGCGLSAEVTMADEQSSAEARAAAVATLETRCAQPAGGEACEVLGEYAETGSAGVPQDATRAMLLYRQACDDGLPSGCRHLGSGMEAGLTGPRDYAAATLLYQRACAAHDAMACAWAGDNVGLGLGAERDLTRAFAYWRRACSGGEDSACNRVRRADDARIGDPADERDVATTESVACAAGDLDACVRRADRLATARGIERSFAEAIPLYQRACAGENMRACGALGALLAYGVGAAVDRARGLALLDTACAAHEMNACEVAETIRRPPVRSSPFGF